MGEFNPMTVAEIIEAITKAPLPCRITAFDGSATGPADSPLGIEVASPEGLAHVVTAPGDLGLARAYITGGLVIHGDHPGHPYAMFDALQALYGCVHAPSAGDALRIARSLPALGALKLQEPPAAEKPSFLYRRLVQGLRRHSKERDKESVSAHYDVSNDFYERVLGPSMTYTCAYFPTADASLEEAQERKFKLVFDKLNLREGDRLLDVGCGWGGMVRYAARRGVKAIGVTLSQQQYEWGAAAVEAEGLGDLAEVRMMDYRDVPEEGFDAVSAIGILEHIGKHNYDSYFEFLEGKLKPGGRMLNHCITYPDSKPRRTGKFIDRYIFPDGELAGVGDIVTSMNDHGFEILHSENMRMDYQKTLHHWCENLKEHWEECMEITDEQYARLWGLYMAGSEWGFEHNIVQLHQVLGVKPLASDFRGAFADNGSRGDRVPDRMWWDA